MMEEANVDVTLMTTEYANHAMEIARDKSDFPSYDGVIAVGGDGKCSSGVAIDGSVDTLRSLISSLWAG